MTRKMIALQNPSHPAEEVVAAVTAATSVTARRFALLPVKARKAKREAEVTLERRMMTPRTSAAAAPKRRARIWAAMGTAHHRPRRVRTVVGVACPVRISPFPMI